MENEYKKMIKSSGIVAFVQVFQMIFALIRNKGISLLVGAAGFGVWSLFQTFIEMLSSFSVFGLDQGGVREIAKSSESKELVGKTIYTFRLIILVLSVLFGILVFFFAPKISIFLFGTDRFLIGVRGKFSIEVQKSEGVSGLIIYT
ncbi:MAG: oligosaccharide flippase family protein [Prevotella sp.]